MYLNVNSMLENYMQSSLIDRIVPESYCDPIKKLLKQGLGIRPIIHLRVSRTEAALIVHFHIDDIILTDICSFQFLFRDLLD